MAYRDYKKIERVIKNFSQNVGGESGESTKTICFDVWDDISIGSLKIFSNNKELEQVEYDRHNMKLVSSIVCDKNSNIRVEYFSSTAFDVEGSCEVQINTDKLKDFELDSENQKVVFEVSAKDIVYINITESVIVN